LPLAWDLPNDVTNPMTHTPHAETVDDVPCLLSASGHTDVGRKRKNNEDCFALLALGQGEGKTLPQGAVVEPLPPAGVLLVVADGMGGAEAGEVASRLAVETVVAQMRSLARPEAEMGATLRAAVAAAHSAVFSSGEADTKRRGMGCTLSVLWLRPGRMALAQVGDSRIYRWRCCELKQMTRDQTVAQGMVDRGEITAEQAKQARFRGVLEQVIGGAGDVPVPQVEECTLECGDRFLLCSDGCHDCLAATDFSALLGAEDFEPAKCARQSVDEACRRSGHDNITVVAAGYEPARPSWRRKITRWFGAE